MLGLHRSIFWGVVVVGIAGTTCSSLAATPFPSAITGECVYNSETNRTVCIYTVVSGTPALSHLIIPFAETCIEQYEVTSSFFRFESPRAYDEPFCGEIYGIKSDREMADNQVETFYITYIGDLMHKVDIVYAALKYARECERYPVPGVVDCAFIPECRFSLDFTEYNFYIRKPGIYAGCLATLTAASNLPIHVTFESFGDLQPTLSSSTSTIPACYAVTPIEQVQPPQIFLAPAEFNEQTIVIPDDKTEHAFSLWVKTIIGREISGCDYTDDAIIRIEIENLEEYIDFEQ